MWAANADNGKRWLSGTKLVPGAAGAPFTDGQAQHILLADQSAAWLTKAGQVVMALHEPADDTDADRNARVVAAGRGQAAAARRHLPDVASSRIASTMKLQELDGDGDECGGENPYRLTIKGDAACARRRVGRLLGEHELLVR